MKKYLFLNILLALVALPVYAVLEMPSKQVSVRTNTITTIGQTNITAAYAPTNSLQAHIEWMDDHWADNSFDTNKSYYFTPSTTQSLYNLLVRSQFICNSNGSICSNFFIAGDTRSSNDMYVTRHLYVGSNAVVGNNLTVSNDLLGLGDTTISGALVAASITTTGTLSGTWSNPSNDMSISYLGYPYINLTSVNTIYQEVVAGSVSFVTNYSYLYDKNQTTHATEIQVGQNEGLALWMDLLTNYDGYAIVDFSLVTDAEAKMTFFYTASGVPAAFSDLSVRQFDGPIKNLAGMGTNRIQTAIMPIRARAIGVYFANTETAVAKLYIHEFRCYGTTNQMRNLNASESAVQLD